VTLQRQEVGFGLCILSALLIVPLLSEPAAQRFSGFGFGLAPLVMLVISGALGLTALWSLRQSGFFRTSDEGLFAGSLLAALLATVLVLPTIVLDIVSPFPQTINVPLPDALVFYPTIALVAQTVFFLVPAALVFALTRRPAPAILIAALVEPVFQVTFGFSEALTGLDILLGLQIFVISLVQLLLFRRYGLFAMLSFRLVYYLHWHILWGQLRLGLLFQTS
jgi:hypothetical protein